MNATQLYTELTSISHSRENRLKYANIISAQPELIPELLVILFMVDDKMSCRAGWVLESVAKVHLEILIPYLHQFTGQLHQVHLDSAVRPAAKICEYLAIAYNSKNPNRIQEVLTSTHQEKIIEVCFDWLLNDEKIAAKAYAMNTLNLLGKNVQWVHPELALILKRDLQMQSSGFKSRAKKIIQNIERG